MNQHYDSDDRKIMALEACLERLGGEPTDSFMFWEDSSVPYDWLEIARQMQHTHIVLNVDNIKKFTGLKLA